MKADNVTNTKFDVYLRGSSNIRSNPVPVISNLSTSYERRWFTAKVTGAFTTLAFRTTSNGSNGNTSATLTFRRIKVEAGQVPTDWTVAPEDVLPVSQGGTGATTALEATKALGVFSNQTGSLSGDVIPENADLNDYTTPGVYISTSSTVSKTLDHTPTTTSGFKLFVDGSYHSNYIRQFAFTAGTYLLTHRVRKANGTWTEWAHIYDTVNKPSKSDVGLGNVDNKSSATIRGEITS